MAMMDWNTYREQVMSTAGSLAEVHPELMKGFMALDSSSGKTKHLDAFAAER